MFEHTTFKKQLSDKITRNKISQICPNFRLVLVYIIFKIRLKSVLKIFVH